MVLRFLDYVADSPSQAGDFEERDNTGRPIQVKRLGNFWIWYWADHPVKEVKVLAIERRKRTMQ